MSIRILKSIESALREVTARYDAAQVCVVSDAQVPFESAWPTLRLTVSEEQKSLETVARIWDFLFAQSITRRGLLVCVGGGVLTDLGGFAAATYKRGIDYVNIPTTLLAMVDASSGGKTGINYGGLKNSIGCFAPPVETLICPVWLASLPAQELLSGFGEMLKTGLIEGERREASGERLWEQLLRYDMDVMDTEALVPLIEQSIAVKERIVASDPKETGLRKVLNFGHTFGHALEEFSIVNRPSSNRPILHGYAVVYGLIAELYLSVTKLGCPKEPLQQLTQLMLHYYGRPNCKCSERERLIDLMRQDKKNERTGQISCTLIREIGAPVINQVITPEEALEALEYLFSL